MKRAIAKARSTFVHAIVGRVVRLYFDTSYRLLTGSDAGRRLLAHGAVGLGPFHGYFTVDDRDVLLADLAPRPDDRLLDLGCGIGGIAIELHRRSGVKILGVDISPEAVLGATARARRAGIEGSVQFLTGDLARPPLVGATRAYAVDSLMFIPDLVGALRGIGMALGTNGRLFATLLILGSRAEARLRGTLQAVGGDVVRLEDVTPALAESSRARAGAAAALRRDGRTSRRGGLAMRLVIAEETVIGALVKNGRVTRWRFVVGFGTLPGRDV